MGGKQAVLAKPHPLSHSALVATILPNQANIHLKKYGTAYAGFQKRERGGGGGGGGGGGRGGTPPPPV